MTDDDLVNRLLDAKAGTLKMRRLLDEAAEKIRLLSAQKADDLVPELTSALKGLSDMYCFAWDRVDGGLMMMDSGLERFEREHGVARDLLRRIGAKL